MDNTHNEMRLTNNHNNRFTNFRIIRANYMGKKCYYLSISGRNLLLLRIPFVADLQLNTKGLFDEILSWTVDS